MFFENTNELAQHKLLLLYILDKVDLPIDNSEVTQFVLENNYMNYFIAKQYLSELKESKFIDIVKENNKESYKLSPIGKEALNYFKSRIPLEIMEEIDEKYMKKKEEMIKETQLISHYYKKDESQYIVVLKVIERDLTLFNLSLNVVSNKQAKFICDNWRNNPEVIYKNILDILTHEDQ